MADYKGTVVYNQVLAELVTAARYGGLTTYQRVARIMALPDEGNHMGKEVGQILGEISEAEVAEGRPMLSAVCIGTSGDPGKGFYACAKRVGRFKGNKDEDPEFWRAERKAVNSLYVQGK